MTAHLAVPALEPENEPATVSCKIITGVLKDELASTALSSPTRWTCRVSPSLYDTAEASTRAIEAGADVLLMPKSAEDAINGVSWRLSSGQNLSPENR